MHLRPRLNSLEKNIVCIIYPGYQKRGLPVCYLTEQFTVYSSGKFILKNEDKKLLLPFVVRRLKQQTSLLRRKSWDIFAFVENLKFFVLKLMVAQKKFLC